MVAVADSARWQVFGSELMKLGSVLSVLVLAAASVVRGDEVSFNRDIRPLLADRCFHCHGPDEADRQADLRLDRADGPEGAHHSVITPGSVDESELWQRITSEDPDVAMPPADSQKKPFTADEKELIRKWIEQGAAYEQFWAFLAPTRPTVADDFEGAAIDWFVQRRLRQEKLSPSPVADKRTLIRRLSLDLTGLPPSREEIRDFLADDSAEAYERLVDRLLSSPHYGEHMAKYWLDLVRFADTNGVHHDHYRELTPYRDWVIRSFNENLSYDDFVRYQLAGDLYAEPSRDQLIASGFHRLHMIIDRGTALPEESFNRNVLDRVTSVGTAFLGLTVQCAVCHDHKYDPITMKDFYSLTAFFNNIEAAPETGGRRGTDFQRGLQPPYINLPTAEQAVQLAGLEADVAALDARVTRLDRELDDADDAAVAGIEALKKQAEKLRDAARKARDQHMVTIPAAMIMKERAEKRPAHILIRGAYDKPGEQVSRATPGFLPPLGADADDASRMDLANWLVRREHPLTARVAVNRFWQQMFGVGLVRTSEDFGTQGEWPSHPDLLDHLAVSFMQGGWDVRKLLKEIVMSQTYRQSSHATAEAWKRDAANRLLARGSRYRMDSEMIRDQVLASSGLLSRRMFGKSVKPPQPAGLWTAVSMPSSYPRQFQPDAGEQILRRSVYTFWKRGMPPPQMTILDAPAREECIARRERTNTPLQALLLLNEAEYLKAARHLAARVLQETSGKPVPTIDVIYETITSHRPDSAEREKWLKLAVDLRTLYEESPDLVDQLCGDQAAPDQVTRPQWAAWTMVTSSIYNLDITKNRQ